VPPLGEASIQRMRERGTVTAKSNRVRKVGIAGATLALCATAGLVLSELYPKSVHRPQPASEQAADEKSSASQLAQPASKQAADERSRGTQLRASAVQNGAPKRPPDTTPKEILPWEVTAENAKPAPPGFIPAASVRPPQPDPATPEPPRPVEPPNPTAYRPPTDNPGGVNGDRPPRPVPGLE
jgi:hypothetical protein